MMGVSHVRNNSGSTRKGIVLPNMKPYLEVRGCIVNGVVAKVHRRFISSGQQQYGGHNSTSCLYSHQVAVGCEWMKPRQ